MTVPVPTALASVRRHRREEIEGQLRTHTGSDTTQLLTHDRLVQPQLAAREVLRAERVEAKGSCDLLRAGAARSD